MILMPEGKAREEERIKKLVANMQDAWNRDDIKAFDSAFSEDVDFVNTAGKLFRGRDQIEPEHTKERELLKGTELKIEDVMVGFLGDEIAVVHATHSFPPTNRRATMTALVVKRDGEWRIRATQSTMKS